MTFYSHYSKTTAALIIKKPKKNHTAAQFQKRFRACSFFAAELTDAPQYLTRLLLSSGSDALTDPMAVLLAASSFTSMT